MWNLILPNFKKSTSIRVRMQKLWPFYRSTSGLRCWKAEYDSKSKSGKAKICCLWQQRLIQWMERLKQYFTMNLGLAKREFSQGGLRRQPINVVDQFVSWEGGIGERHKQSMEQITKTKNTNLTSNKTQPRWTQTQQSNWNEICGSKGYRTAEDMNFFWLFWISVWKQETN
jgi:hypothetical protein